ncbi:hypothetical protein [Devosia alba]|uniref:hypothetical protein n=1 Tax=Devosia alba TaxID=3152360 RepID=UPI0032634A10
MNAAPSTTPRSRFARPKACMGYPSQNEAVIALYEAANHPKLIAKRAGIPLNSVYRVICNYRRVSGRDIAPNPYQPKQEVEREPDHHSPMWDMEEPRRRMAIIAKARSGARKTLEAAGL